MFEYGGSGASVVTTGQASFNAPPVAASLIWVNQGTATATDESDGLYLFAPKTTGDSIRALVSATPAPPYTFTVAFAPHIFPINSMAIGLILRDSVSGNFLNFSIGYSSAWQMAWQKWTNPTTFSAQYANQAWPYFPVPFWLRLKDDFTNRTYWFSEDGKHWMQLYSVARTDFVTPNQLGIYANAGQATYDAWAKVVSWQVTTP